MFLTRDFKDLSDEIQSDPFVLISYSNAKIVEAGLVKFLSGNSANVEYFSLLCELRNLGLKSPCNFIKPFIRIGEEALDKKFITPDSSLTISNVNCDDSKDRESGGLTVDLLLRFTSVRRGISMPHPWEIDASMEAIYFQGLDIVGTASNRFTLETGIEPVVPEFWPIPLPDKPEFETSWVPLHLVVILDRRPH
jgi:hypothetical protein